MRSLDELNGAWSQTLPCETQEDCPRLEPVMGGDAVLDKETGLVWEHIPDTETREWNAALIHCYIRELGGRRGWRLPTYEELTSLIDLNNLEGNPDLSPGHPFSVLTGSYWSTTPDPNLFNGQGVFLLDFDQGQGVGIMGTTKNGSGLTLCVRGGSGSQNMF